jgi:uncharacterized membrane protein
MTWSLAAPAVTAAFLASIVEVIEAFTIVLAVATLRGWRPAAWGTTVGLGLLAAIVLLLGPLLDRVPIHSLQLAIGTLLLLFGMGWLRKASLRAAGIIPLHDEDAIFKTETDQLNQQTRRQQSNLDWVAGITALKAVLLEGLEVVFIVIAVGAGRGLLMPPSLGALSACALVLTIGAAVHRPLSRVPENTVKFGVARSREAFSFSQMFRNQDRVQGQYEGDFRRVVAVRRLSAGGITFFGAICRHSARQRTSAGHRPALICRNLPV